MVLKFQAIHLIHSFLSLRCLTDRCHTLSYPERVSFAIEEGLISDIVMICIRGSFCQRPAEFFLIYFQFCRYRTDCGPLRFSASSFPAARHSSSASSSGASLAMIPFSAYQHRTGILHTLGPVSHPFSVSPSIRSEEQNGPAGYKRFQFLNKRLHLCFFQLFCSH